MGNNEQGYYMVRVFERGSPKGMFSYSLRSHSPHFLARVGGSEGNKKTKPIIIAKHLSTSL
jgi:hypothetical protein